MLNITFQEDLPSISFFRFIKVMSPCLNYSNKKIFKTIALYLGKFVQTGINFSELLKRSDEQLEELLGLIKPVLPEDADPRKLHFNRLVEYFNKELSRTGVK